MLRLTPIIVNFLCFLSDAKYIYTPILKFSDLSISKSFSVSMFNTSKGIDTNIYPKLKENSIRSIIAILHSIFAMLTFF